MYGFGPIAAAVSLLSAVLAALTSFLTPLAGGFAAGAAVVVLTMLVRLLLVPLGVAQVRAEKARARIAPRLAELTARHKNDPTRLVEEQRKVFAEAGTSPLAGCLPGLAQAPVLIAVYGLFTGAAVADEPLLEHTFAGVELGSTLGASADGFLVAPVFAVLLVLLAALAWASRRYLVLPSMAATPSGRPPVAAALSWIGFLPVVIAAFVPLAAGLYLVTTTAWTLGERLLLRRLLP
ncbi:YidC/Oxa1 family membrane protein insertase [Nocardiopsis lucentensis]|uniref:YidC/Oxa1 family membrane protein insertase n=1 Tax=Nocardiopsis lucentensis TaxID=53441 RepID=UPI00034B89E9|nr:membrane protein insertase YidC [Nocardiopsis lucentensis]